MIEKKFTAIYHGKKKDARIRVNMKDGSLTFPEFVSGKEQTVGEKEALVLQKLDSFTVSEIMTAKPKK